MLGPNHFSFLRRALQIVAVACTLALGLPAPQASGQMVVALSGDGTMRTLSNPYCTGPECTWITIDKNSRSVTLAATSASLFQLHESGAIWLWRGQPCDGDACPHWTRIDNNRRTVAIAANSSDLFQLHRNGEIWRWTGEACDGSRCRSWERLDRNPATVEITAAGSALFQRHESGAVWRWKGDACEGEACRSWEPLDRNRATRQIVAAAPGNLYQRHESGAIWRWDGQPCQGPRCFSWSRLDNNPRTRTIAAAPGGLYQLHRDGAIWRWTGRSCQGNSCPGWERLDNNRATRAIAAAEAPFVSEFAEAAGPTHAPLFQAHRDGAVWRWAGRPCEAGRCPHWVNVSGDGAFTSYNPDRGGLFVFGGGTRRGSLTGPLRAEDFGYGGMRFARTADTRVEINVLMIMSTYANSSFDEDQTEEYYVERYFGARRRIESYFNRNSRDLHFTVELAGVVRVEDDRTLNCAHRWSSCPGDGASFEMASVEHLESLSESEARPFASYDRDGDGQLTADELFVMKIEGLPDRGPDNPFDDNGGIKRTLPRCATLAGTGKQICGDYLPLGDETNFITTVHEFAHLFGAEDIYGAGSNYRYSLMGATWEEGEFFVHLDPWHKMRMGLTEPRIIPIPDSPTAARETIRLTLPVNSASYEPVLFYDPARPAEYFLLEFRRGGGSAYDYDVAGSGLVIWHVRTNASFRPLLYSTLNPALPGAKTVAILGAPGQTIGRGQAWTRVNGTIALGWPGAGDSGLRLQVQPFGSTSMFLDVEWWRN